MKQLIVVLLAALMLKTTQAQPQLNEMVALFQDFEVKAASGNPAPFEEAEPVFNRFEHADAQSVRAALPAILSATTSQYVSVRRLAAEALLFVTFNAEGRALLSAHDETLSTLLVDSDVPVRRLTGLCINNLPLNSQSPLTASLTAFLARQDAVSTIGAGVAGLVMKAAPDDDASNAAVVRYMQRKDQTPESRGDLLQSVRVSKSHNRQIGRAVAVYAADSDKGASVNAIQTLQGMGSAVISDNRELLAKIAGDSRRDPGVRSAAEGALGGLRGSGADVSRPMQ